MVAVYKGQPTFSGGEFDPSLQARVDLEKYATGLKTAKNFIIHPQGGASNRPGFGFVAKTKFDSKKSILIPFEFSSSQSYAIEAGDKYFRFYMNKSQIQVDPTLELLYNPATTYAVGDWATIGLYKNLDCGSDKILSVYSPYGDTHTTVQIAMATNAGDSISTVYSAGTLSIGLANATPSKNSAALIQVAVRAADAIFADWCVTESNAYAAARPTTGVSIAASAVVTDNKSFIATATTGIFPHDTISGIGGSGTVVWSDDQAYEIASPYADTEIGDIKFTQSADTIYIVHPDHAPITVTRSGHSSWAVDVVTFEYGPFMAENSTAITISATTITAGATPTLTASAGFFAATHVGALLMISHNLPSQTISGSLASAASSSTIVAMGAWRLITHGTWTGKIVVEKSLDGSTWVEVRAFSSANDFNVNTFGVDDSNDSAAAYRLTMSSYTSGTCNYDLTLDACTVDGIVKITAYTNPTTATGLVIRQIAKTAATLTWSEGSWSDYRGWPSAVAFYEDRLALGNTATEPQTSWMSKTGEYTNFGISDPLVDSDSISVVLPSRKLNGIKSFVPIKELLVLTSGAEATIGSGSGEPISPLTVTQRIHGVRGSNGIDPVVIGNRAVYAQPQGTALRDIGFDYTSDGFSGDDISIVSAHLFRGHNIVDLAYQQEPDSIIWALRNDGILLACTYMREQQVLAWSWVRREVMNSSEPPIPASVENPFPPAHIESICVIRGNEYDELWTVVEAGQKRTIEVLGKRDSSLSIYSQIFLDRSVTVAGIPILNIQKGTGGNTLHVTLGPSHGLVDGDIIGIHSVRGMTEANWDKYQITNMSGSQFDLVTETFGNLDVGGWGEYVDGGYIVTPTDTITGLSDYEGFYVSVVADGKYYLKQKVVSGQIVIAEEAYFIHVGIPYECDLQSLKPELSAPDGTVQGRKVRASHVITRFHKTRGGKIGPDEDHLYDVDFGDLQVVDKPTSLVSGDVKSIMGGDWDNGGQVFYRQDKPMPVTVLAFIPAITVGG